MTDEEERDMWLKRTPGGVDALPEADRSRVGNARDPQMDRARDFLKAFSIYSHRLDPERKKPKKLRDRVAAR